MRLGLMTHYLSFAQVLHTNECSSWRLLMPIGKHCALPGDYQNRCRPEQTSQKGFSHTCYMGLSAHAHNNYCEVHGWLLSGSEELTYFAALF